MQVTIDGIEGPGTFRGTLCAPAGRPPRAMRRGRVCAVEECHTVLSVYNDNLFCWQHEHPHPYAIRAPRTTRA